MNLLSSIYETFKQLLNNPRQDGLKYEKIRAMNIPRLPEIPKEERTPLVETLLSLLEEAIKTIQKQAEDVAHLKDEIAILKGEKKRPKFKASKLDKKTGKDAASNDPGNKSKRPGSEKESKTSKLRIDHDEVIQPTAPIPPGSRFKGYRDFVVQGLIIRSHNTRYRLACWETPDGQSLVGELPPALKGRHFDATLTSYILYQHHQCQVTQPLLHEQLQEWGIQISTGQINAILCDDKARFHEEKNALLSVGLSASTYITVDDTGTRHQGKNGYVTHIGNSCFAWFESTLSKNRINFLSLLRAGHTDYWINEYALDYLEKQGLAHEFRDHLCPHVNQVFVDEAAWQAHLDSMTMTSPRHRRIATEAALLGSLMQHGIAQDLAVISDDAGQFNVLRHGLCWVHAERLVHTLVPLNEAHREDIAQVRSEIWSFYADLKKYKQAPDTVQKCALEKRFDAIFIRQTRYATLDRLLRRIHRNKPELLLVLARPDVPLHTNGSESDIRDHVKKQKVSGGTRSDLGRQCRDTFSSLKKTCRKLGVSFWNYLTDRIAGSDYVPPLAHLVKQRLNESAGLSLATSY